MNVLRMKAALAKYSALKDQGAEVIAATLKADDAAKYTDKEIQEISDAILSGTTPPADGSDGSGSAENTKAAEEQKVDRGVNEYYEEHNVSPIYEDIEDPETGEPTGKRKLKGKHAKKAPFGTDDSFEKLGKPLRGTWITKERADMMNEHSEISKRRFYKATPPQDNKIK